MAKVNPHEEMANIATRGPASTWAPSPSPTSRNVLVLGAGIIGLTSAIRLHEAGYTVHVIAKETPTSIFARDTSPLRGTPPGLYTSSGSGGYWMPFHSSGAKMEDWCTTTYHVFEEEAANPGSGVTMYDGFILRAKSFPTPLPWYAELAGMTKVGPEDDARVPQGYKGALRMRVPIAVMDIYLPLLEHRLRQDGIPVELYPELTLEQASAVAVQKFANAQNTIIVNCTGIGARTISQDPEVRPGRGVTVRVRRPAGVNYFITEDDEDGIMSHDGRLAYCLPRGEEYTLGGTIVEGEWSTETGEEEARALVERCSKLIPGIERAEVTGTWTGLRPLRNSGIRLEVEKEPSAECVAVVANYGHGGGGVTSCWGTADEVVIIVNSIFSGPE